MPKGKPPRRKRKRTSRQAAPPAKPQAARVVATPLAVAPPGSTEAKKERVIRRASTVDYSYVRRDVQRILLLTAIAITTIIVLSFFLP